MMDKKYKLYFLTDIKENKIKYYKQADNILDILYNAEAKIPTLDLLKKYKEKDDLGEQIKKRELEEVLDMIKLSISKLENKVPLYDAYSDNMYLINQDLVYYRVVYQ